jgi:ribosomal protein S18 acetylase RimI-like enzyme
VLVVKAFEKDLFETMSIAPGQTPDAGPRRDFDALALRPEQPQDQAFLFELYSSTRQEELDAWGWPSELRGPFLKMQFQASQGYHTAFPTADFQIVLLNGNGAGRLVVNRAPEELRIVDIALLPEHRNAGIGSALVRQVCDEAAALGKPVRLCVLKSNRAQRLYARLGFVTTGQTEPHLEMEWRAADNVAAGATLGPSV